jgi:hypothetical protein
MRRPLDRRLGLLLAAGWMLAACASSGPTATPVTGATITGTTITPTTVTGTTVTGAVTTTSAPASAGPGRSDAPTTTAEDTTTVDSAPLTDPATVPPPPIPPLAARLAALRPAAGDDTFEVWVCRVPTDTTDPTYGDPRLRLPITPDDLVARAGARLAAYFETISHGRYHLRFITGGVVTMAASDTARQCVDHALDQSGTADAVLAVADAEHTSTAPGGWGTPGARFTCTTSCTADVTRRAAYVGASDFHPSWGPVPALDLLEHEIGHTLGLPHSGEVDRGEFGYTSALDVMSDSAAPRDVDPTRLDGPDTLGIDRLALGWLSLGDVAIARDALLAPSTAVAGTRLLLLPVDAHTVLTVELLTSTGFDAHLPRAGVTVHRVDDTVDLTTGRRQEALVGSAPYTDLLQTGASIVTDGWRISVDRLVPAGDGPGLAQVSVVQIGSDTGA